MSDLRAAKQFEMSDRLRDALALMDRGAGYAFPGRYRKESEPNV